MMRLLNKMGGVFWQIQTVRRNLVGCGSEEMDSGVMHKQVKKTFQKILFEWEMLGKWKKIVQYLYLKARIYVNEEIKEHKIDNDI